MNNVEIEDIHHHDFTSVTEWEVFIAGLEVIIHDWKLTHSKVEPPLEDNDFVNLNWVEKYDKINFADVEFILKHFKLQKPEVEDKDVDTEEQEDVRKQCQRDMLNTNNDFCQVERHHLEIAHYYGIREFMVLVCTRGASVTDETRIKILLSSVTIAVSNTKCEVPIFVQVMEPWQKFYMGVSIGRGSRVYFNMVHLKKVPLHCKHLTGLLMLFKQKIGPAVGLRSKPALVSVRFGYIIKDWSNSTWTQEPPDFDFMQGETIGVAELGKLPFGATCEPIAEFHLYVTWPEISENTVVDSETFSDLDPESAPKWSIRVYMNLTTSCLLGEYLSYFHQTCSTEKTVDDIFGSNAMYDDNHQLNAVFNVLTEPKIPTISTVFSRATSKSQRKFNDGLISDEMLLTILYFLFPDADDQKKFPYSSNVAWSEEDKSSRSIKTCPLDSLVWRLAIVAAHCTFNLGGVPAFAQLWQEVLLEIRFRWEKGLLIPGIAPGLPECVRTCLLYQKLQMLNCCIGRKKAQEELARNPQSMNINESETEDVYFNAESEEEEFFECDDELADTNDEQARLRFAKPVGRLTKHPTLKLIESGEPLYLPITQDPVPKTEDQLEEDVQVMIELGTDKYASEMRARLMSASLLSDMESFKAANPGAILEDFIKWYSPRDWIDEESLDKWGQPSGHLSERMLIENNPWETAWKSAQPVPVSRQKRLFNETREAEKVLHYLASKSVGQAAELLLSTLIHAGLYTLSQAKDYSCGDLNWPNLLKPLFNRLQNVAKAMTPQMKHCEDLINEIKNAEGLYAQTKSLILKLGGDECMDIMGPYIKRLLQEKEVLLPDGPKGAIRTRITKMFCSAQKVPNMIVMSGDTETETTEMAFPEPSSKEFILRTIAPRPSLSCVPHSQRLYARLERESILLAGAFSEDTVFL